MAASLGSVDTDGRLAGWDLLFTRARNGGGDLHSGFECSSGTVARDFDGGRDIGEPY
jgi:hypothetical protein